MHNIRHDIHIVYIKDSLFLSFRQHLPEQLCFRSVKILPHCLHSPYITEKAGTQSSVPEHHHLDRVQMCFYQPQYFRIRSDILFSHFLHSARQHL